MKSIGPQHGCLALAIAVLTAIATGCADNGPFPMSKRHRAQLAGVAPTSGAAVPIDDGVADTLWTFSKFSAYADPPPGWTMKVNNAGDDRAEHIVWLSPSGRTAFGIIFFRLPFPVGHDLAFQYGFLREAEKREGPATVVDKHWDNDIQGLRFIVDTRKYRVEAKFFVRGTRGWGAYVGTRNDMPYEAAEHEQGIVARESAEFGEELKPGASTQPTQ